MSANAETAVRLARYGWPVFPTLPDNPDCPDPDDCDCKKPLTVHGCKDAETSPRAVARFWSRHPDANVAIATGYPGPVVLDVDVANGKPGMESLENAGQAGLIPEPKAQIRTPSGGLHLYYASDSQGNASMAKHGIDLRGKGGYVLAPPSQVHGRAYEVVNLSRSNEHIEFDRIRYLLEPQRENLPPFAQRPGQPMHHLVKMISDLPNGHGRGANAKTFWAMTRAYEAGQSDIADQIAAAAIERGLRPDRVQATQRSAKRKALESRPIRREFTREAS